MHPHCLAFIDESSVLRSEDRQEYLICAAIDPVDSADEIRRQLTTLKMKGQIKLHWSDEDQKRRRQIVDSIVVLEPLIAVVTHANQPQRKTERFRRKCLETIYYELSGMGIRDVTCESRMASQDKADVAHLLKLRNQKFLPPKFDIAHRRGGDDPLLWLPDVFLGAINANHAGNSEYYDALRGFIVYDEKTPDSL